MPVFIGISSVVPFAFAGRGTAAVYFQDGLS